MRRAPILRDLYVRARATRYAERMQTRAIALVTLVLTTRCSEWVPATVADATYQPRVRVRENPPLDEPSSVDARVVTTELEHPSPRTLLRLSRRGDHFEVRRSNVDRLVLPVAIAIVGTAALAWMIALAAQYKPSLDADWSGLGGLIRPP